MEKVGDGYWPVNGIRLNGKIADLFHNPRHHLRSKRSLPSAAGAAHPRQRSSKRQKQKQHQPSDARGRIAAVFGSQPAISTADLKLGQLEKPADHLAAVFELNRDLIQPVASIVVHALSYLHRVQLLLRYMLQARR
jgi:hypothetical protein